MVKMKVEEFVEKIIDGERDFKGIKLPDGTDLRPYVERINAYLQHCGIIGLDLENASLVGLIAPGIDLRYDSSFFNTDLTQADLSRAHLPRANFVDATLTKIDLRNSNIAGGHFDSAVLTDALLGYATLVSTTFSSADLTRARCNRADLFKANLYGARAYQACFTNVRLENVNLERAYMSEADLRGANLDGAYLEGTVFYEANLRNVRNLGKSRELGRAIFGSTIVRPKEQNIIQESREGDSCLWDLRKR